MPRLRQRTLLLASRIRRTAKIDGLSCGISGHAVRILERFRAKHALGLDPWVDTGSREENASKQEARAAFRFHRDGKALVPEA
jgi:hypothetical protein